MRPSKLKTPLAALRSIIKIESLRKDRRSPGVQLSIKTIADWLNCSVDKVNSLCCGRAQLSLSDALVISQRTGANHDWLMSGDPAKPVDGRGQSYTQETFKEHQALRRRRVPLLTQDFGYYCALIGEVLLRAAKFDKEIVLKARLSDFLVHFYSDLHSQPHDIRRLQSEGLNRHGLIGAFEKGQHRELRPDLGGVLDQWEKTLKTLAR